MRTRGFGWRKPAFGFTGGLGREKIKTNNIPFNRSSLVGGELSYIHKAMRIGQVAGDQTYSRQCQGLLEKLLGVRRALVTTSCTHALEMAALLFGIREGDEVIVPAFTFVSTANAFVLRGAKPVFCDIRPDTLNLDESQLEKLITPRTKAIVVVHYAGVACEMNEILAVAQRHGLPVVEDNAHGLFGKYRGRWLGTWGAVATLSFHETKNITCGEGGALLLNDPSLIERAEILREKGTDRAKFFRGQVDKYTWMDLGSSYVMSDVLAAFLFGQLESWKKIQTRRKKIWQAYDRELRDWALAGGARRPSVPAHCEQAFHLYCLLLPTEACRDRLIAHLRQRGIGAVFHYQPLHASPYVHRRWGRQPDCPVARETSRRLVRLPFYNTMTSREQKSVIRAIREFSVKPSGRPGNVRSPLFQ